MNQNLAARRGLTVALILVLSLAACRSGGGSTAQPSASGGPEASATTEAPASGSAACVVGVWRSDGYAVETPNAKATGGGGFTMTIGPDGRSTVDFTGMKPVTTTVTIGGTSIDSHLIYAGKVDGKLKLPPAGAKTGAWESEPGVNFGTVTFTLDVNGSKVMDHVSLAKLAGDLGGAGGPAAGTNNQPVLGAGTYTCAGKTLTITQRPGAVSAIWRLHREG